MAKPPPSDFCNPGNDYIEPNPDIAGIGVIIAFITLSSVIMVLSSIGVVLVHLPTFEWRDLICPEPPALITRGKWATLHDAREFLDKNPPRNTERYLALKETIWSLSDSQMATGMAIAVAAMARQDIVIYHYLVCVELVWMAFISSSMGFIIARALDEVKETYRRVARVVLAWILFGLVMWLTARFDAQLAYNESVYRFGPYRDFSHLQGLVSIMLMVSSFFGMLVDTASLFPALSLFLSWYTESYMNWMCSTIWKTTKPVRSHAEKDPSPIPSVRSIFVKCATRMFHIAFLVCVWFPCWILSMFFYTFCFQPFTSLLSSLGFFAWGIWLTFDWRYRGRKCMRPSDERAEDEYGFGQIVALTLIIAPLVASLDLWVEAAKSHLKSRKENRAPTIDVSHDATSIESIKIHKPRVPIELPATSRRSSITIVEPSSVTTPIFPDPVAQSLDTTDDTQEM